MGKNVDVVVVVIVLQKFAAPAAGRMRMLWSRIRKEESKLGGKLHYVQYNAQNAA